MMTLNVKGTEYKVKFGYNSFCDTDLMERTSDLLRLFQSANAENDKDVSGIGKIKELFICVRDLLFVGFEKYNPVKNKREIGNILDDYNDEATEDDPRGIFELFKELTEELLSEGFLSDLMDKVEKVEVKK